MLFARQYVVVHGQTRVLGRLLLIPKDIVAVKHGEAASSRGPTFMLYIYFIIIILVAPTFIVQGIDQVSQ